MNVHFQIEVSELMDIWDFTVHFMCSRCGLEMADNVRIFENLALRMGVDCKREENVIINDYSTGGAVVATRLSMARNPWQLRDIDVDGEGTIRRVNGMDLNRVQAE